MKGRIHLAALACLLAMAVAGCSSVDVAKNFNGQQVSPNASQTGVSQINGCVWGYYLFGILPLVTGDPENPGTSSFFVDTVRLEPTVKMVTSKAKSLGSNSSIVLESRTDSSGSMFFWIVFYKEIQVSGNAVK